jgi:hypothetical protein
MNSMTLSIVAVAATGVPWDDLDFEFEAAPACSKRKQKRYPDNDPGTNPFS